jgi:hypothetical protein
MKDPRNFVDWVCDPARTNDELFTVELLIEQRRHESDWAFPEFRQDYDAHHETMRIRGMNPAYQPGLHEGEVKQLWALRDKVLCFHGGSSPDRMLRDLTALRFFPALTGVSAYGDFSDLSPLAALPRLTSLSIMEHWEFGGSRRLQLSACGAMPELERVHLTLQQAWPDLRGVAAWAKLADLRFSGNVLAWEELPALTSTRLVHLNAGGHSSTPLRDLRKLPEMPAVKVLLLEKTESLEGIERYPSAVNVELSGRFADLTPLAGMTNITALTLTGEIFRDLRPLAAMAGLRELRLVRERAIDLSPLADCPQLRRVEMQRCAMMRTELAALNAGLLPEAADFEVEPPRAVGPLVFYTSKENKPAAKFFHERTVAAQQQRERFYDGDAAFRAAETRFLIEQLQPRLDRLLGRGWGFQGNCYLVSLKRFQDTMRVLEVIQLLREQSARMRFPCNFLLQVEPHGDMSEDLEEMIEREKKEASEDYWTAELNSPEAVLQENEEWRELKERRYEYLKREHLLQLRGDEVDPELLSLGKEAAEREPTPEPEPEFAGPSISDEDDGGVAIAQPPPAPPEAENLGEELAFYLDVYEDCIVANSHWVDRASYNLGMKPVEWSADLAAETRKGEL